MDSWVVPIHPLRCTKMAFVVLDTSRTRSFAIALLAPLRASRAGLALLRHADGLGSCTKYGTRSRTTSSALSVVVLAENVLTSYRVVRKLGVRK
jgi:hypothetical protein